MIRSIRVSIFVENHSRATKGVFQRPGIEGAAVVLAG